MNDLENISLLDVHPFLIDLFCLPAKISLTIPFLTARVTPAVDLVGPALKRSSIGVHVKM